MTVGELVATLSKYSPDTEIVIFCEDICEEYEEFVVDFSADTIVLTTQ